MTVYKLQQAIISTDESDLGKVLVYNESRSEYFKIPLTLELGALFGEEMKIFAKAKIVGDQFVIEERVDDPGW